MKLNRNSKARSTKITVRYFGKTIPGFPGSFLLTKPMGMQEAAHHHFGPGVFALNAAHVKAAGCYAVHIGHAIKILAVALPFFIKRYCLFKASTIH